MTRPVRAPRWALFLILSATALAHPPDVTADLTPLVDLVLSAPQPGDAYELLLASNGVATITQTRTFRVAVIGGGAVPAVPVSIAASSDCPQGITLMRPDLDPKVPGVQDIGLVEPGGLLSIPVTLNADRSLRTPGGLSFLRRCQLTVEVAVASTSVRELAPSNNRVVENVDFGDDDDRLEPAPFDISIAPVQLSSVVNIARGRESAIVSQAFRVSARPYGRQLPTALPLPAAVSSCPRLGVVVDGDRATPGIQSSVDLSMDREIEILISAQADDVFTYRRDMPLRCFLRVMFTPEGVRDDSMSNNEYSVVLDLVDENDVASSTVLYADSLAAKLAQSCVPDDDSRRLSTYALRAKEFLWIGDKTSAVTELLALLSEVTLKAHALAIVDIVSLLKAITCGPDQVRPDLATHWKATRSDIVARIAASDLPEPGRSELAARLGAVAEGAAESAVLAEAIGKFAKHFDAGPTHMSNADRRGMLDSLAARLIQFDPKPLLRRFRKRIEAGKLEQALLGVMSSQRDVVRERLMAIPEDDRARIRRYLPLNPRFVAVHGEVVEFSIERGSGDEKTAFPIWFALDCDGVWRIRDF